MRADNVLLFTLLWTFCQADDGKYANVAEVTQLNFKMIDLLMCKITEISFLVLN